MEVEKVLKFDIEYNLPYQNFLYNNHWVTQVQPVYFDKTKERIVQLIDENINYEDESNIIFIEDLLNDLTDFISTLNERLDKYYSFQFSVQDWSASLDSPKYKPEISPLDLPEPSPVNNFDDREEYVIEIVKGFFDIDFDTHYTKEELNDIIFKNNEEDEGEEIDINEIQLTYAKAHLTYILTLHLEMVKEIALTLSNIVKVYKRKKSNIEEKSVVADDLKLEFDLSKTNLGHLFYNLYEIGIIAKDKTDVRDERTKLKNYLNHANIFYQDKNDKSKYNRAQKMNRAMPISRDIDEKEVKLEIAFLTDLTSRLNNRIDKLEEIFSKIKQKYK
ncbi:hypothetical protein KC678_04960 [Candidatus Dojkabacteria bacterium]|uniref:Uncharacterized protein n=1 Tax=Candidatus Dojkabacteria bacterium TaxID=2099670 RepID=A0A955L2A9_9BACT|nr:hypothetical protein [Candidatus Dojkabacteria bacterium]MCB0745854.1 hypothetical protein [Ignavibacteriota bacterium]